jgi:hypothetical protein
MTKISCRTWNELFFGNTKQNTNGRKYPRQGGIFSHLDQYNDWTILFIRDMMISAAKDKDDEFLKLSKPFCKYLKIDYDKFIESVSTLWSQDDRVTK